MIRMKGIRKEYRMGDSVLAALDGVDIHIKPHEFVSIIGPSGSGKSTLMNIIGCLDTADEGTYYLDGQEIEAYTEDELADIRGRKIGFVFQQFNLLPKLTAQENVELPLIYQGMSAGKRHARSEEVLERVGLLDRMDHKPTELSGGQQQRVAIARALAGRPSLLLADEPTGNLDSRTGADVMRLFHARREDRRADPARHPHPRRARARTGGRKRGGDLMQLAQTVSMAFKAISGNKVRAFLTMLGVIIGVMSVIVLIAIGQGTTASVTESIASMGTNLLTVSIQTRRVGMPGGFGGFGGGSSSGKGTVILTLDDILALEDDASIQCVSPTTSGSLTVKAGSTNTTATVMGVLPAYAQIVNQGVQSGRYIIDADVDNRSAVCVIGPDLAEDLFGNTNVVGNTLHIDGRKFKIVGVLESKGTSMGGSSDDRLILPFTLAQRMLDSTTISSIYISAVDSASVDAAQDVVERFLYKKYQNDSTYSVMNQTQMLETANETASTLSLMLGGIAGISLLVGGIGIMNIMLVSVTERTREIGIRKAIGAKRKNILLQFLIESIVISGMGGLLGLGAGYLLMRLLEDVLGMTLTMSAGVAELAIGFSMAVGVIFGLYPADKASKLKPIDALHYD